MTSSRPVVLSVAALKATETIDGGDTVVVRFEAPDGREIALLIPRKAASELGDRLDQACGTARPDRSTS
ncbi:MAG TPA: hypothetical protein VF641_00930 [Methylobacterium sp.]|jgi:hypothetical protein